MEIEGVRFVISERSLRWDTFFETDNEEEAKKYYNACITKCSDTTDFELMQDEGLWCVKRRSKEWEPVRSFHDEDAAIKFYTFSLQPAKDKQYRLERCEPIVGH